MAFCFLPLGWCYLHIWGYWLYFPAILILACVSSSLAFHMMHSAYKINEPGDKIQPSFVFNYLLFYPMISPLIYWLFNKSMLVNFYIFVIFFVFCHWFLALFHCDHRRYSVRFQSFKTYWGLFCDLTHGLFLENALCALGKNLYSDVAECFVYVH